MDQRPNALITHSPSPVNLTPSKMADLSAAGTKPVLENSNVSSRLPLENPKGTKWILLSTFSQIHHFHRSLFEPQLRERVWGKRLSHIIPPSD